MADDNTPRAPKTVEELSYFQLGQNLGLISGRCSEPSKRVGFEENLTSLAHEIADAGAPMIARWVLHGFFEGLGEAFDEDVT